MKRQSMFAVALLSAVMFTAGMPAARAQQQGQTYEALSQRLAVLDADPKLASQGAYERFQAREALEALDKARSADREAARYVAERRVTIAELAARNQAMQGELLQLERQRSDLLIEASRRDAASARAEAERLRLQAQMQAEEAARLREQADAGEAAMQDVEVALKGVAGAQEARLAAARERQSRLAREEAELVAGAKLPPFKRERRGDVFTLSTDAFTSGRAALTSSAEGNVRALAAYIQAMGGSGTVRVAGQGADVVRDALTAAGVPASRIQTAGGGTRLEVVVP
ncbi:OmpA family protein [Marilutibacter alkalisoli]|uniref:OmpA family protein n=1 Tax=Marilutibacter alkalisoli TaxID=2591633 RepID=A0A514BVI8_9GAMM|nr:hypothetical protein [Lysobacter alkalisoli]QDH71049.1 hypothetical protein FKV23_13855 [Lysobacter alkalisoli]